MKKTHVRFIKREKETKFEPYHGNKSNHALRCEGCEVKTVTFEADTRDSQINTHNYRIGLLKSQ
jgi:hypothetical protein